MRDICSINSISMIFFVFVSYCFCHTGTMSKSLKTLVKVICSTCRLFDKQCSILMQTLHRPFLLFTSVDTLTAFSLCKTSIVLLGIMNYSYCLPGETLPPLFIGYIGLYVSLSKNTKGQIAAC